MDYLSNVRILVNNEGLKVLEQKTIEYAKQYYAANENETWAKPYCKKSILEEWKLIYTNYDDEIILQKTSIKWDTSYEEVKWIYNALDELTEQKIPYQIIVIKEKEDRTYDDFTNFDGYEIQPLATKMFVEINFSFE